MIKKEIVRLNLTFIRNIQLNDSSLILHDSDTVRVLVARSCHHIVTLELLASFKLISHFVISRSSNLQSLLKLSSYLRSTYTVNIEEILSNMVEKDS